jgi:hypothetical protein
MFLVLFTSPSIDKLLLTIALAVFIFHSYTVYQDDKGETHQTIIKKIQKLQDNMSANQQVIISLLQDINQQNNSKITKNKT